MNGTPLACGAALAQGDKDACSPPHPTPPQSQQEIITCSGVGVGSCGWGGGARGGNRGLNAAESLLCVTLPGPLSQGRHCAERVALVQAAGVYPTGDRQAADVVQLQRKDE